MKTKKEIKLVKNFVTLVCKKCGLVARGFNDERNKCAICSKKSWRKCVLDERVKKSKIPNYEEAFSILMEYWDSLPDEAKKDINKELKRCGL